MKITKKYLESINAFQSDIDDVDDWNLLDLNHVDFINELIGYKRLDYASWLIVKLLKTKKKKVQYAIFSADQVIDIFEKRHPDNDRLRKVIEAAKAYLINPNEKTKAVAAAADAALYDADVYAGAAATAAVYAAAADDAATADAAAAAAIYAAAAATDDVADAAADAAAYAALYAADADDADDAADIKKSIIEYGLTLIK